MTRNEKLASLAKMDPKGINLGIQRNIAKYSAMTDAEFDKFWQEGEADRKAKAPVYAAAAKRMVADLFKK